MAKRTVGAPARAVSIAILVVMALLTPVIANASQPTPDIPAPDECLIEPRALPLFASVTPLPVTPAPVDATATAPRDMTEGQPAEPAVVDAVTATVRESLACRNGGDFARAYALVTDEFLVRVFGGPETIDPMVALALEGESPRVRRGERLHLVSIAEVRVLADGRAGALVTTIGSGEEWRDYLIFIERGDRWLIDEAVTAPPTPALANLDHLVSRVLLRAYGDQHLPYARIDLAASI